MKEIKSQSKTYVSVAAFKNYFEQLLNPSLISEEISYAPMYWVHEDLDKPITVAEIEDFLKKTKPNKAPGEDWVTYEFNENAPTPL